MNDELIIVEVKPKMLNISNEPGHCVFRLCFKKATYEVNRPITHKPEYLAIREPGGVSVEMVFKIDQANSQFKQGIIVPKGTPTKVSIPLRVNNKTSNYLTVWYTSFRTLLTHSSTDEFTLETSEPITHLMALDERILCNGYECKHYNYCRFFNHADAPVIKSSALSK